MAFIKGFQKKVAKRPDPNSRPQLLYPAVPENYDGWPDKTAAGLNHAIPFRGIQLPKPRIAPPTQPRGTAMPVGLPKLSAVLRTFGRAPDMGMPKAIPVGQPHVPKPTATIPTPAPTLKDSRGKVTGLPTSVPMPANPTSGVIKEKTAAAVRTKKPKNVFSNLKNPMPPTSLQERIKGPQLQSEPLGATMPNQSTGGGITGGYGSN